MTRVPHGGSTVNTHPIDRVLPLLQGVKSQRYNSRGNPGYTACCPAHNDSNPSLEIWEDDLDHHAGLCCYAGCSRKAIVEAIGLTESDLYVDGTVRRATPEDGISLLDLAADKLIYHGLLAQLGVTDDHTYKGRRAVYIPYFTQDGKPYERTRIRTALIAKEGSYWNRSEASLIPYGLERLEQARKAGYQVFVEGESDCWTLWQQGFPALGIPGAENIACLKPEYLEGIERIYIVQEPDQAGHKFARELRKHLLSIGYQGVTYILDLATSHKAKDPNELHKRGPKAFKALFQQAIEQVATPGAFVTYSLRDLLKEKLAPPRWAIRGLIPEGLTTLAGKPKLGKSWMALQIALAVATGGKALAKIEVERADVLYLALEDNKRRLQSRALQLLADDWDSKLGCFDYQTEWKKIDDGGIEAIEDWLQKHPAARLVVIDTLAKVRPRHTRQSNIYEDDYAEIGQFKALADKYHCAIILIHHTRKEGASDPLDEISGSTGGPGAADTLLVLRRTRGQANAELHVTGRDVDEQELAITFDDQSGLWTLAGDAEAFRLTQERQEIIDVLHDLITQGAQTTPLEIQKALNVSREKPKSRESVRYLLSRMNNAGDVSVCNGIYTPNRPYSTNTPNTPNTPNRPEEEMNANIPLTDLSKPVEPNGDSAVRAVSLDDAVPLTGLSPTQNGNHSNGVSPVRAVRAREQIPECPDCHTVINVQWHANVGQYRHDALECGKWLGSGQVAS